MVQQLQCLTWAVIHMRWDWRSSACAVSNLELYFRARPHSGRPSSAVIVKHLICSFAEKIRLLTDPSPHDEPSAAGRYATQYPLAASKQNSWAQTRSSLKHAEVPRSRRHWASSESNVPGNDRPSASSSCGALCRQLAVSPLQLNIITWNIKGQ